MIAEEFQHIEALFNEEILLLLIVVFLALFCDSSPERKLWLHIDSKHIRSDKRSLRGTAGVITIVVHAV